MKQYNQNQGSSSFTLLCTTSILSYDVKATFFCSKHTKIYILSNYIHFYQCGLRHWTTIPCAYHLLHRIAAAGDSVSRPIERVTCGDD
jgi:hypothetical protein